MLSRRTFGTSSALAATLAALPGAVKAAVSKPDAVVTVAPRGNIGRLRRLPTLEDESKLDFLTGMGTWSGSALGKAAMVRGNEISAKAGIPAGQDVSIDESIALFDRDPVIELRNAMWGMIHNYSNDVTYDAFHGNADAYLAELETHDNIGPGSLALNAAMTIPEYTRHEIHQQQGGYVGDPFSGHMYHADTNQFYHGANDQDQRHAGYASNAPVPADGKVTRIVDLGCGIGQLAVAMQDRFPDAEVHGVDIAAPMLRYGHMHAVGLNSPVHFKQALAEETGYPDNHFDIVVSYLLHHEVTAEASRKIIQEAHRILRPGGVFYPIDFNFNLVHSPIGTYMSWIDHRWNNEPWRLQYASLDFAGEMQKVGFAVEDKSEKGAVFAKITATKQV
jgi:ubiquinone/menaquinone biosynthesis C-methylase UbiE